MRNVCLSEYDIIGISETWLTPNVITSELGFNNSNTYCYDRNSNTSNCSRGGGVLLYLNNKYYSRMLSVPASHVENLFVLIYI
jgi:hypothetical protein